MNCSVLATANTEQTTFDDLLQDDADRAVLLQRFLVQRGASVADQEASVRGDQRVVVAAHVGYPAAVAKAVHGEGRGDGDLAGCRVDHPHVGDQAPRARPGKLAVGMPTL